MNPPALLVAIETGPVLVDSILENAQMDRHGPTL